MITLRPASTRGNPRADWINSYRTFTFPPYVDPKYINFSDLETINDDKVQPNGHVPWHEHKNMEIFGYIIEGVCHHTDSLGNKTDLPAGTVQRMSAGSGIWHTEGNSSTQPNRYLQLWVRPNKFNTPPEYDYYQFTKEDKLNKFCNITEKLQVKQDVVFLSGFFTKNYEYIIEKNRNYYLYIVSGNALINSIAVVEGDGMQIEQGSSIVIENPANLEIIVFDLRVVSITLQNSSQIL